MMSTNEKLLNPKIDCRDWTMPPSWVQIQNQSEQRVETLGDGVYQSGPGRKMVSNLIEKINSAEDMIVVCSFIIADKELENALIAASKRRVRIYVLTASEVFLEKDEEIAEQFDKKRIAHHKNMLDNFAETMLIRSALHFHAKVVLIDPISQNKFGMLFTCNLTSEGLERNEELGVSLNEEEINEVFQICRWAFWEDSVGEISEPGVYKKTKSIKIIGPDFKSDSIFFTTNQDKNLEEQLIKILDNANKTLYISNFGWDLEQNLPKKLLDRLSKGLGVIILARERSKNFSVMQSLSDAGAIIYGFEHLHAKAIWTDNNEGMIFSANFEQKGMQEGFELGVLLTGERLKLFQQILEGWMNNADWEFQSKSRLGDVSGKILLSVHNRIVKKNIIKETGSIPIGIDKKISHENQEKIDNYLNEQRKKIEDNIKEFKWDDIHHFYKLEY